MKSLFSFHHPTNTFTQKFIRNRSFVCKCRHCIWISFMFRFSDILFSREIHCRELSKSVRNYPEVRDGKIMMYYCNKMFWQIRMSTKEFSVLEWTELPVFPVLLWYHLILKSVLQMYLTGKLFYVLCLYDQYLISAFITQTYIQISFLKCSYKSICKKYNLFFKYNEILTELRQWDYYVLQPHSVHLWSF